MLRISWKWFKQQGYAHKTMVLSIPKIEKNDKLTSQSDRKQKKCIQTYYEDIY